MLISELECLHQAQNFVDRSTNGQVVDGDLTQDTLVVDDEETSKGNSIRLTVHSVCPGNFGVLVGQEWNFHLSKSTLFAGQIGPCQVGKVRIG